jgi:hypothetical protein
MIFTRLKYTSGEYMQYTFYKSYGSSNEILEKKINVAKYKSQATFGIASVSRELWPEPLDECFGDQKDTVHIPTFIDTGRTLFNSSFTLGGKDYLREFLRNSHTSEMKFGRDDRHWHAGLAWNALKQSMDEFGTGEPHEERNILDVGNAGETWLHQVFNQFGGDYGRRLKYFTVDVQEGMKLKGDKVTLAVPDEDWVEIVHDAREIDTINPDRFPDRGFDMIHVAQASCELLCFKEYARVLESLYELLSPSGTLVFSAKKYDVGPDLNPTVQAGTTYSNSDGEFSIGENISILKSEVEYKISARHMPDSLWRSYKMWELCNIRTFFEKCWPDDVHSTSLFEEYTLQYLNAREEMKLDTLSFFPMIRHRSTSIQSSDTYFNPNSSTLSCRAVLSVTKPE